MIYLRNVLGVQGPTKAQIIAYFKLHWTLVSERSTDDHHYYRFEDGYTQDIYLHLLGDDGYHEMIMERIAEDTGHTILEVYNTITGADIPSWEAAVMFVRANTKEQS